MKNRLAAFALGLCSLIGAAGSAAAQDQISLRLGSLLAPSH
ncbi:hypothetical protein [Paracoccus sp. N5]|nr:hypothetical protein [Paracoccus sp. N5]